MPADRESYAPWLIACPSRSFCKSPRASQQLPRNSLMSLVSFSSREFWLRTHCACSARCFTVGMRTLWAKAKRQDKPLRHRAFGVALVECDTISRSRLTHLACTARSLPHKDLGTLYECMALERTLWSSGLALPDDFLQKRQLQQTTSELANRFSDKPLPGFHGKTYCKPPL